MTANVIYDERLNRHDQLMKEFSRQEIFNWQLWPSVHDPSSVIRSINLSHKQIIRWAKENDRESVCIMEDDVMFPSPNGWKHFLEGIPVWPWDIYLAGTYGLDRPVRNPIARINGLQCYIVHNRFYDTFLAVPDDKHIDVALDNLGLYYVEYPFIALQCKGWSSNSKAFSDKNAELKEEDIYGGLPK